MRGDVDEPRWRAWWRIGFATFLGLALVVGLFLSFRPAGFDEDTDLAGDSEATEAPQQADETEAPGDQQTAGDGDQDGEGDDGEEDEGLTDEEREALIEAARDPEQTTVQVLDAGGGGSAASDVASVLGDLGYDVVAINSARDDYSVTTVLFTEGNEAEAEGLRAREERVTEVGLNERLSDAVDLHVMVGPDWDS
ncbi:MAG TPA: LytR C-terminal domain-containing protein [Egibacteraceae bacterium]|nr:LytR C-terminal domain-containing protein [Egibacteraceae bacterium]